MRGTLAALAVAAFAWLAWLAAPHVAVAGLLVRLEAGQIGADDLDAGALNLALVNGIADLLRQEAEQRRRDAERLAVLVGAAASLHAAVSVPVLLAGRPHEVAAVKRTQQALRPAVPPPVVDPRPEATAMAQTLATPAGIAALAGTAMARAPVDWPQGFYDRFAFVQPRLTELPDDRMELVLAPSGIAPFWQSRVATLTFRRAGLLGWRLDGLRLPSSTAQARALINGAQERLKETE